MLGTWGCETTLEIHRGISSNGRALALHARGTGIDTRILHLYGCWSKD